MLNKCFWLTITFLGTAALTYCFLSQKKDVKEAPDSESHYIGNSSTMKLHLPSCRALPDLETRTYYTSRHKAIDSGYVPCGICKP